MLLESNYDGACFFIRGLLDSSETELINSADTFAADYSALLNSCHNAQIIAEKSRFLNSYITLDASC